MLVATGVEHPANDGAASFDGETVDEPCELDDLFAELQSVDSRASSPDLEGEEDVEAQDASSSPAPQELEQDGTRPFH